MKKKIITLFMAAALAGLMCMVSFAGTWQQRDAAQWYYIDDTTGEPITDFQFIDGKWYFFSTAEDSNKGIMLTGIQWIGHKCYFLNPNDGGAAATNLDYGEYHFGADGYAVNSINNPVLMGETGYSSRIGINDKLMVQDSNVLAGQNIGAANIDDAANPYSKNQPEGYREEEALEFLDILNEARAEKGRTELDIDDDLMEAAKIRAMELAEVYDHVRPDGSSWKTVLDDLDIRNDDAIYGENGNYYHHDPQKVYESWYRSKGHKNNMMDSRYKKTGVACYFNPDSSQKYWWIQIFSN